MLDSQPRRELAETEEQRDETEAEQEERVKEDKEVESCSMPYPSSLEALDKQRVCLSATASE